MILSDRDMRMFIANGWIGITPGPRESAFSSTSLDLTLDDELRSFHLRGALGKPVLDPAAPDYAHAAAMRELTTVHRLGPRGFELQPQAMVLAWTRELIALNLLSRIAARVEGKSSLARIGLAIHVTAPTIHAGFKGAIQLEIVNHGPLPIRLRKGMKICQLIFEQALSVPEKGYQGQFQDQGSNLQKSCDRDPPLRKSPVPAGTGLHVPRAVPGGA